jgi:hypothetical protein
MQMARARPAARDSHVDALAFEAKALNDLI